MSNGDNSWERYQNLVIKELDRYGDELGKVRKELEQLRVEIAMLKVKSGLWGAAAGTIPAIVVLLLKVIQK